MVGFTSLFAFLEISSFAVLQYRYSYIGEPVSFENEKTELYYKTPRFHPYRWYSLTPNFQSDQWATDYLGYRNENPQYLVKKPKMIFFGGSTMYSTQTDSDHSIPSLVSQESFAAPWHAMNFGLGGYSTGAEMSAFIETMRIVEDVRIAVFYDGVNEVGNYIERIRDSADEPAYDVVSYPQRNVAIVAMENHLKDFYKRNHKIDVKLAPKFDFPYSLAFAERVVKALKTRNDGTRLQKFTQSDYAQTARIIADIYASNVKDIAALAKGHGVEPVFILQPTIYESENPTKAESSIIEKYERFDISLATLYPLAYQAIRDRMADEDVAFYDLSKSLAAPGSGDGIFTDYCHLTAKGNALVTEAMAPIIHSAIERATR